MVFLGLSLFLSHEINTFLAGRRFLSNACGRPIVNDAAVFDEAFSQATRFDGGRQAESKDELLCRTPEETHALVCCSTCSAGGNGVGRLYRYILRWHLSWFLVTLGGRLSNCVLSFSTANERISTHFLLRRQVSAALRLSMNKAPGWDGVPAEGWKVTTPFSEGLVWDSVLWLL